MIPVTEDCLIHTAGNNAVAKSVDVAGTLTLDTNRRLTIEGRDGLTVQDSATLRVGQKCWLILQGGGTIVLDGTIKGVGGVPPDSEGTVVFKPNDNYPTSSHTYITTGSGMFLGATGLRLFPPVGSAIETLVLGPDNAIHGTVLITIPLINHGLVDPNNPIDGGTGDTITLECDPKIGDGDWKVTCDDCDEDDEKNTMVILTPVVGTGDLTVGHHGLLQVKRLFSLHGDFSISGVKAKIEVDPGVPFDMDRFPSQACPQ